MQGYSFLILHESKRFFFFFFVFFFLFFCFFVEDLDKIQILTLNMLPY